MGLQYYFIPYEFFLTSILLTGGLSLESMGCRKVLVGYSFIIRGFLAVCFGVG